MFSLKTTKSGGLCAIKAIAEVAAAGIPCHGGTAIESPIGTAPRCTLRAPHPP